MRQPIMQVSRLQNGCEPPTQRPNILHGIQRRICIPIRKPIARFNAEEQNTYYHRHRNTLLQLGVVSIASKATSLMISATRAIRSLSQQSTTMCPHLRLASRLLLSDAGSAVECIAQTALTSLTSIMMRACLHPFADTLLKRTTTRRTNHLYGLIDHRPQTKGVVDGES